MRVVLTNLSNELYEQSRFVLNNSAKKFGVQEVYSYDFDEIKYTAFFSANREILEQPTGLGYWLWKPYIILEAMKRLSEGDIVIYSDCGIEIINDLEPLLEICRAREPILLFGNANDSNSAWTKRDCFVLMDCDNESYWNSPHCDAAFSLFRKSEYSIRFLNDWLRFGSNKYIISDLENECGLPNLPNYIAHRWDQSILSLLAQKYKLSLYRMPTQFGNHYKIHSARVQGEFNCVNQSDYSQVNYYFIIPYYNSHYGQLLDHHRKKNNSNSDHNTHQQSQYPNKGIRQYLKRGIKRLIKGMGINGKFFSKETESYSRFLF
ncbi:hypothetical protein [Flavisolibacter tropicus]|uniref:hypothetical protein n=1 Tax=Flavisolibacter tropicus TaxID=1492898 RepID=UPI00083231A3|nr:hypothetical protein [Flavisolibacter tropicus]